MRRLAIILLSCLAAAAFAVTAGGAGEGDSSKRYTLELDNAFGLVEGADLKVAGVRAGRITAMRLDRRTRRALVEFEVDRLGFGSLRRDVFCETRPQSLIGEYFIDCDPGTASEELPGGSTIPVEQTASTVPADLINNIMRRPERERLRIILNELGAGVSARADELNEAIRRASPALRQTGRVLAILGRQNTILRDLVEDADVILAGLSDNRRDVVRWARETRETAAASAERRDDIAASLQRLPEFLRRLRPTMAALGRAADAQAPALTDLSASAERIERLLTDLEPFARASKGNFASLGAAARRGRPAMRAALPVARELEKATEKAPELANNADIITAHLDDRGFAVEKDPRSPGGQGYTGFEALLQYFFDQTLAINVFDDNGYILKVNLFESECGEFQNAESLLEHEAEHPGFYERCLSALGPNQQGITVPDPTKTHATGRAKARKRAKPRGRDRREGEAPREQRPGDAAKPPIDLGETLEDLLGGRLPDLGPLLGGGGAPQVPRLPGNGEPPRDALLDYLLGS